MNYIISICNPQDLDTLIEICHALNLPMNIVLHGRGSAVRSMLDILGIESNEKRVVLTFAGPEKTQALIREQKRRMFIGVPGHGIVAAIPIKSIGGGKTMAFLSGEQQTASYTPRLSFPYELIVAIANKGQTDMVMNAAREAGAAGGTVLHGKGTGEGIAERFYQVSISQEKEVILIVSKQEQKTAIMRSILKKAGPNTEAGAIVFSLPISEAAGFGMFEDDPPAPSSF